MKPQTLVIIPTYNEEANIARIVPAALGQGPAIDVLVVDDNSPDGTAAIVENLARTDGRVHLLRRPGKQGLGTAYIAGFKWGLAKSYDYFMEMDADFSHDPRELPNFVAAIADADLVLGSRYQNGIRVINWPLSRLLLSKAAAHYVHLISGLPVADPTGGFKCFRRQVLEAINLDAIRSNGYAFQVEMTYQAWMLGFRIKEIPIVFTDRFAGTSKMSSHIVREALWQILRMSAGRGFRRSPGASARPGS